MLRAVVDVNVLVSALLKSDGVPARLMREWQAGAFELVASERLLAELVEVASRPAIARRLDRNAVDALVETLRLDAILADDPPAVRVVRADPRDDYLVALARAAGAHAIVTGDRHLLGLEGLQPPALTPATFAGILDRLE